MKSFKKLQFFTFLCLFAGGLAVPLSAHEAKAVKVTGSVQVQLPGSTSAQPLTGGMAIPEGALVTTAADGQVYLEALPGVVATIEPNSTVLVEKLEITKAGNQVTSQEALLDLKKGNVISTLDPTKKAINRYGVRTPKGVAAARGTVYGVSVNVSGTTVATLSGLVTINLGNGVTVDIPVGMAVAGDSDTASTIAAAIADSGQTGLSVEQLLQEAVQAVADNVAANTSAAGGSDTATAVLAAVVNAAASAAPARAAEFAQTAVAAASSSTSATGGNTAAVAAITEAAVRANPGAATNISQAAANAVVQTKVAEAVAAATASGQDATAAATAGANAASQALQAIAQAALAGSNASADSAVAQSIINSVNSGSQQGMAQAVQQQQVVVNTPAPTIVQVTPPPASPTPGEAPSTPIVTPPTDPVLPPVSPSGSGL